MKRALVLGLVGCMALPGWAAFDLKEDTASQEWCFVLIDESDGTIHTGETIANTEIKLVLPGGTTETNKNSGGATEIGTTGRYCATFDATDTATAGSMTVVVRNTGSVEKEYVLNVLTDNWYDAKYGTDELQAHVVEYTAGVIDATAIATGAIGNDEFNVTETLTANPAAGGIVDASLGGNLEVVFETDFATNYNTTRNAWVTNYTDTLGTPAAATLANGAITDASLAGNMEIVFETDFATNYNTTRDAWVTNFTDIIGSYVAQTGDSFARLGAPVGSSVVDDIATIEGQTDEIGFAGAGLTAVPWNSAWDAEVQSEVADGLAAYDPPTNTEMEARTVATGDYYVPIDSGTASAVAATTITLDGSPLFEADSLNWGASVLVTSATAGAYQCRTVTDIDGASVATVERAWDTTPTGTVTYDVYAGLLCAELAQTDANGRIPANVEAMDANVISDTQLSYCGTGIQFTVQSDAANSATQVATNLTDSDYTDDQFGGSAIPKRAVVFMTGNAQGLAATIQSFDTTGGAAEDLLGFTSIGKTPDAGVVGCIF